MSLLILFQTSGAPPPSAVPLRMLMGVGLSWLFLAAREDATGRWIYHEVHS